MQEQTKLLEVLVFDVAGVAIQEIACRRTNEPVLHHKRQVIIDPAQAKYTSRIKLEHHSPRIFVRNNSSFDGGCARNIEQDERSRERLNINRNAGNNNLEEHTIIISTH